MKTFKQFIEHFGPGAHGGGTVRTPNSGNQNANNDPARMLSTMFGTDGKDFMKQMRNVPNSSAGRNLKNSAPDMIKNLSGLAKQFTLSPQQQQNMGTNITKTVSDKLGLSNRANDMSNRFSTMINTMNKKGPNMLKTLDKETQPGGKIDKGATTMLNMMKNFTN